MHTFYAGLALLLLQACHAPTSSESATADPAAESASSAPACFLHVNGRDSVKLRLTTMGDSVYGTLHFKNYQIDGSRGTVHGRLQGDTLFVQYDFLAEGTQNMTEEAFLKQDERYVRGFGEREATDGVHRYVDRSAIDFTEGQVFVPVACAEGFLDK